MTKTMATVHDGQVRLVQHPAAGETDVIEDMGPVEAKVLASTLERKADRLMDGDGDGA